MAGSRKNIKNFDISYKMAICEEYLELIKQNDSLSKRDFAISKGIKPTTFYDWINTYSSYRDNKSNDEEITTTNSELTPVPKFVQLSEYSVVAEPPISLNRATSIPLNRATCSII